MDIEAQEIEQKKQQELLERAKKIPPYDEWLLDNIETILHMKKLLRNKLPEHMGLETDLGECVAWYERATSLLADANAYLDIAEDSRMEPKTKYITDLDRETKLKSKCALERKIRDKIEGIVNAFDKRISLGQSILKYAGQTKPYLQEG